MAAISPLDRLAARVLVSASGLERRDDCVHLHLKVSKVIVDRSYCRIHRSERRGGCIRGRSRRVGNSRHRIVASADSASQWRKRSDFRLRATFKWLAVNKQLTRTTEAEAVSMDGSLSHFRILVVAKWEDSRLSQSKHTGAN